jgi:hypothetical protein
MKKDRQTDRQMDRQTENAHEREERQTDRQKVTTGLAQASPASVLASVPVLVLAHPSCSSLSGAPC